MQLLYILLSVSLAIQIFLFIFLSIPSSSLGLRARILRAIGTNPKIRLFILIQSIFLILAFLLYLDNKRMAAKWTDEKNFLLEHKNPGTEIRKAELSYKTLLVQRNMYICMTTIFVTLALNAYITLFRHVYIKRDAFDLRRSKAEEELRELKEAREVREVKERVKVV